MVLHRPVVLPSASLDSYALSICLDILSFNQLTYKVRRNGGEIPSTKIPIAKS